MIASEHKDLRLRSVRLVQDKRSADQKFLRSLTEDHHRSSKIPNDLMIVADLNFASRLSMTIDEY